MIKSYLHEMMSCLQIINNSLFIVFRLSLRGLMLLHFLMGCTIEQNGQMIISSSSLLSAMFSGEPCPCCSPFDAPCGNDGFFFLAKKIDPHTTPLEFSRLVD